MGRGKHPQTARHMQFCPTNSAMLKTGWDENPIRLDLDKAWNGGM